MDWFDIPNYEGLYQISLCGSVKRIGGGIISDNSSTNKYKKVNLWKGNKRKSFNVHRLLAEIFLPKTEGQTEVNHKDGNKMNNSLENLEWCTRSENSLHSYRMRLSKSGESSPVAKIKNHEVKFIRAMFQDGLKVSKIYDAYKHKASWATIYNITHQRERVCDHGMS